MIYPGGDSGVWKIHAVFIFEPTILLDRFLTKLFVFSAYYFLIMWTPI